MSQEEEKVEFILKMDSNPNSNLNREKDHCSTNLIDDSNDTSNSSNKFFMCRICHIDESSSKKIMSPCECTGTLSYVHERCLQKWLSMSGITLFFI
jgi:E3 ubiquitin-protein ligase DOA10